MKKTLEQALLDRVVYIGDEIPEALTKDKRTKTVYLGYPQELLDEVNSLSTPNDTNREKADDWYCWDCSYAKTTGAKTCNNHRGIVSQQEKPSCELICHREHINHGEHCTPQPECNMSVVKIRGRVGYCNCTIGGTGRRCACGIHQNKENDCPHLYCTTYTGVPSSDLAKEPNVTGNLASHPTNTEEWEKEFDELTDWMDSAHGPLSKDLDELKALITRLIKEARESEVKNAIKEIDELQHDYEAGPGFPVKMESGFKRLKGRLLDNLK